MLNQYNKVIKSWLPKPTPVLDDDSISWLFDVFEWSLEQFGSKLILSEPQLILPNNEFFPGRETSLDGMAQLIFSQVQNYTNLQNWRFLILPQAEFEPLTRNLTTRLILDFVKGESNIEQALPIPYDPQMVANPEALIGSYVHSISQYLALSSGQEPPGGFDNLSMTTEVLAVQMGFGVMLANTGFTHRGGCGSSSAALSTRKSALSQFDVTYALAIFCILGDIPVSKVTGNLKSSLRSYFKKSYKNVQKHQSRLNTLRNSTN